MTEQAEQGWGVCDECAALVMDLAIHKDWHRGDVMLEPNAKRMIQKLWRMRHEHE